MVNSVYYGNNKDHPSTLVICCPKLNASSSHSKPHLFSQPIPILQDKTHFRRADTLPWTITASDFAILTLFQNTEFPVNDKKVEMVYMCKPVSCKLYLASAPSNNSVSRNVTQLGNISEQDGGVIVKETSCLVTPYKSQDVSKLKHTIGFVVHADWSVCEWFISENQVNENKRKTRSEQHIFFLNVLKEMEFNHLIETNGKWNLRSRFCCVVYLSIT